MGLDLKLFRRENVLPRMEPNERKRRRIESREEREARLSQEARKALDRALAGARCPGCYGQAKHLRERSLRLIPA